MMRIKTIQGGEAHENWQNLLDSAANSDDTIIEHNGRPTAVLIAYEDYVEIVDELEDVRADRRAVQAYEQWKADPSGTISLDEFRDELIADGLLDVSC